MGGSSKKVTVGYKYYIGMHMILCHGPVDRLLRVRVDEKKAWSGDQHGSGSINVAAKNLFGGESREGGVSGTVDFEVGGPTQGKNSYLASKIESDVPNFRGVVGAVLRQVYIGLNPYLKKWDFRISRIHVRQNGLPQWYDVKAEIPPINKASYRGFFILWEMRPSDGGGVSITPAASQSSTFVTGDGLTYNIPLRITGRVEYRAYVGSVPVSGPVVRGGGITGNPSFANEYKMVISDPPETYYFNNGNFGNGELHDINAVINIQVKDGATVTLTANTGSDTEMAGDYQFVRVAVDGVAQDMNPAHIIRECLTDPDWGMGYAETDIDDTSFRAAADTLFDEGMGISLLWDRQMPIEDFLKEILKHIDAVLYIDRTAGKFVLRLIRGDYNAEDLLLLNEDNIIKLDGFQRTAFGELTNSVTVNYWDSETGNTASLTVQDIALAQMQGAVINTTVQYPGFTNSVIASRVAQRDLKALSTPLITCTIYANPDAKDLNIGDVFLLSWDDYELDPTPMRVNSIAYGDGKKNQIKITAVQDVFALPTTAVVSPPPPPPVQSITPVPVSTRQVFEVPYLELVQVRGQTEIDNILAADPLAGFVGAAAIRPLSGAINARMLVDPGSGYEEVGALEFAPGAKLASAIGRTETTLPIQDGVDLDQVVLGTWLQCDSEIMAVTALSDTSITVKRGCLDTVPATHAAGAALVFWDNYAQGDERQYASGETVKVKLQTVTGEGELPAEQAPEDVVTMSARAARPYPPGAVRINSQWFPEVIRGTEALSLSWAHRDRKQQTGQNLIGFTDGSIGPEPGTSYALQLYDEDNVLRKTVSGLSGTSYEWTTEGEDSGQLAIGGMVFSRNWDDGSIAGQTLYGTNNPSQSVVSQRLAISSGPSTDAKVRFDAAPPLADFELTCTLFAPTNTTDDIGIVYRTTYWGNANDTAAYYFGISTSSIVFGKGSNNSAPQWVQIQKTALSTNPGSPRNVRIRVAGTRHQIWVDGVLRINLTDASYTGAGYFGARLYAGSGDSGQIDDLAIYQVSSRLNGKIRLVLKSQRGDLESHQAHDYTVKRAGYGYCYGEYYGGV